MKTAKPAHGRITVQSPTAIRVIRAIVLAHVLTNCAIIFQGCGKDQKYEPIKQICPSTIDKAEAMKIVEKVLAKMQFAVEKYDVDQGIIHTRPLPGAQSFEFWRSDNAGRFNKSESNLHTIRRTAYLHITTENNQVCITCDVKTERLSVIQQNVDERSRVFDKFPQTATPRLQIDLKAITEDTKHPMKATWIDLGADDRLSTKILQRIKKQISKRKVRP